MRCARWSLVSRLVCLGSHLASPVSLSHVSSTLSESDSGKAHSVYIHHHASVRVRSPPRAAARRAGRRAVRARGRRASVAASRRSGPVRGGGKEYVYVFVVFVVVRVCNKPHTRCWRDGRVIAAVASAESRVAPLRRWTVSVRPPVRPDWTLRGQTMSCDCLWTQTQTRLTGVQATRLTMRQNPGGDCH